MAAQSFRIGARPLCRSRKALAVAALIAAGAQARPSLAAAPEAAAAQSAAQSAESAAQSAQSAARSAAQPVEEKKPAASAETKADPQAPADPVKRVVYLPESVKQELIGQLRKEVLEQARSEGWASSNLVPAWVQKLRVGGDVRGRFERVLFPHGNANNGAFPDFNAINTGNPFDVNFVDYANERYLNVDQNRTRPRLRARLGVEGDLGNGFALRLRAGSGESSSPVSTNQTLGSTGNFGKLPLWLDRASVAWNAFAEQNRLDRAQGLIEKRHLMAELGRFENPFFTTELLFAKDVGFDGLAVRGDLSLHHPGARLFLAGGAFPLQITSLSFPAERPDKFPSRNKWLYAAQVGIDSQLAIVKLKGGLGVFAFSGVAGRISNACDTNLKNVACDSDGSRPGFAQNGNTYVALRAPSAAALALEGTSTVPRYQYFGLASRFAELTASLRAEIEIDSHLDVTLEGESSHNAAFNRAQTAARALNNRGAVQNGEIVGAYQGGGDAGLGRISIGTPSQERRGDWRFGISYRYVESDAVLDALNDADFGLGGTNLKGFTLEAAVSMASGVTLIAKWLSANAIAGPLYGADVLQLDLQARF